MLSFKNQAQEDKAAKMTGIRDYVLKWQGYPLPYKFYFNSKGKGKLNEEEWKLQQ